MAGNDNTQEIFLPSAHSQTRPLVLTFDPDAFRDHLEDFEMSGADETAFLKALWSILVGFVDLGFEIHPVQQAIGAAGPEILAPDSGVMLASKRSSIKINNKMSAHRSPELQARGE